MNRPFILLSLALALLIGPSCAIHRGPVFNQIHPGVYPGMSVAAFKSTLPDYYSHVSFSGGFTYVVMTRKDGGSPTGVNYIRAQFQNGGLVDAWIRDKSRF